MIIAQDYTPELSDEHPMDLDHQPHTYMPNSILILILGILSIAGSWFYGIVGLISGIIALLLIKKATALQHQHKNTYKKSAWRNIRAGRRFAIVGVSLSGLFLFLLFLKFIF